MSGDTIGSKRECSFQHTKLTGPTQLAVPTRARTTLPEQQSVIGGCRAPQPLWKPADTCAFCDGHTIASLAILLTAGWYPRSLLVTVHTCAFKPYYCTAKASPSCISGVRMLARLSLRCQSSQGPVKSNPAFWLPPPQGLHIFPKRLHDEYGAAIWMASVHACRHLSRG